MGVGVPQEELLRAPAASSTDSIPTGFCSQKLWGLIFLALESWAGAAGVGLGLLTPETPLLNIYLSMWVWDQPILHLHPSYQSGGMWFL